LTVLLCIVIGSWNNYAKEKQFQKLTEAREEREVIVIRDGGEVAISVHSLLVGDIIKVNAGDQIPADCIYLSGSKLAVDESSQTGETKDVEKEPLEIENLLPVNPFLISGTMVQDGRGLAVVVCVGENTRMGQIQQMMGDSDEMTPLQQKLNRIANNIGVMGLFMAGITTIGMTMWLVYDSLTDGKEFNKTRVHRIVDILIYAITIVVMAVPEGLPLAVTLSLAYSVSKMKDENNLVRQLDCKVCYNVYSL
jgi:magnesium-transporting ATPase (P-type)